MNRRLRIDDLYEIAVPEQPAISPDGRQIAYVLRTADRESDRDIRALWIVATAAGEPRRLTHGTGDYAPAWSPDGRQLAFLRAANGSPQLHLLSVPGGEPEQLTELPLGAGRPAWSPDGTRIAFTAPVSTSADNAPVVTDRLDYKADGLGLLRRTRRHLHVLDVADSTIRQLTRGDWDAGEPAWSPDGTRLAFVAGLDADADLTSWAGVHIVAPGESDASLRRVAVVNAQASAVSWTADGSALLVVGRTDTRAGHAGLLHVALDGSTPVNLADPLDRNVMPGRPGYPGALPGQLGHEVLFCARDRGYTHLYAVPLDGGRPRLLVGDGDVNGLSWARGVAAVVLSTPTSYGEIATVQVGSGQVDIRTALGTPPDVSLFVRQARDFTVSDGITVPGWLLHDPNGTGPRPLLVDIHGGPHNAWNGTADSVHLYHQVLVSRGWAVLTLNPRASDGYGKAYFTAAVGAWGEADARDILEPIDQLVADGTADPRRLAVTGYSYGGFMSCYLTSRDSRFGAAVAGGAITDLTSMAGTSDLGHYLSMRELGGLPWRDAAHFAAHSPYARVEAVRTPTLLLQGAEDIRCPVGQAEQWFTALRQLGIPARLVLYPGGSHSFILDGPPSHRVDWNLRIVEWLEQHADAQDPPPRIRNDAVQRPPAAARTRDNA